MASLLRRLLLATLAATLLLQAGASASAPVPVVKGNAIVDSLTAKRFVPRGVNFPGFEYVCQQGRGYGEDGTKPAQVESTVAAIAAWKVNTVRLPLNQDCWLGEDGLPAGKFTVAGYRQAVEDFTESLNSAGIVVILDLHWSGPAGIVANGLRPMPDDRTAAFWHSVATRFKTNRSVIFDLFNEPHSRWNADHSKVFGLTWECWASGGCQAPAEPDTALVSGLKWFRAAGMKNLTAVVRATGATQPILLSGIDYANDLRGWLTHRPNDGQLIAGFHNYLTQRCRTVNCWNREIAPVAEKVPVLAAEFGQNDCGGPGHVKRFMAWADDRSIGYLAWAWWALPNLGCRNFALVSDLDGTPLAPVGTAFHDHLAALADRPEKPIEAKRNHSGLKIKSAFWNRRTLNLRVKINARASLPIQVRIRLAPDRSAKSPPRSKRRVIRQRLRISSGLARSKIRIPAGLRPKLVVVNYPGDQRLKPKTIRRQPASVSRLTRSRHRN